MKLTVTPNLNEERAEATEKLKGRVKQQIEAQSVDFDMSPLELLLTLDEARAASVARSVSEVDYPLLAARMTPELDSIKKVADNILKKRLDVAGRIAQMKLALRQRMDRVNSSVSRKQLQELLSKVN